MKIVILISIFLLWLGIAFWQVTGKKLYWDAQVNKKCEVDGGIKVYEIIELPNEKFDRWGLVNFYRPSQNENALGAEYILKRQVTVIREINPMISRIHYEVVRRSDLIVLGVTTIYTRGGGDLPGPWESSGFACPSYRNAGINTLLRTIFVKIEN
jgi:hypothetical protein